MRPLLHMALCTFAVVINTTSTIAQSEPVHLITWSHIGQREHVKRGERIAMIYKYGVPPEATYLKYHETLDQESFLLELNALPYTYRDTIAQTRGVCIPSDGTTPVISSEVSAEDRRQIVFKVVGQREKILNGECINLAYDSAVEAVRSYLLYSSTEDGYWIELSRLGEDRRVRFDRRCQSFIVASPLTTRVEYSNLIRYEQIIWTPCANGQWEVRMGSVEMGCRSVPLTKLKELRTSEYMSEVPIEKKKAKPR